MWPLLGRQPKGPKGLWLCSLLFISHLLQFSSAITHLRTARVDSLHSRDDWLDQRGTRQLLGLQDCKDERWGILCGRVQLLLQLGRSLEQKNTLLNALRADKAAICGYLPHDTWLVLTRLEDLQSPIYNRHALLPYSPEYKVAPEWHPVLELVHQQQQQLGDVSHPDAASQHLQLHQHVLEHELVQQIQLHQWSASAMAYQHMTGSPVAEQIMLSKPAKLLVGVHFPKVPASELERLNYSISNFNPAAAAIVDWRQPLSYLVAADGRCDYHIKFCQPELVAHGTTHLDVAVCPQDLSEVLYWLSQQAAVHWLAPRARLVLQNSVASMIVQDNGMARPALDHYTQPDAHPFWAAGLDGKNQIIGIGDSGIDMDSCFFKDPANPFSPPADSDTWTSANHRKVVMYWGLADDKFQDLVGHGTHTSGSLVGLNPADPSNRATGSAKSARLAFTDLSKTASGDVNAPQDVEKDYYPKMYAAGARIFSDSWGSESAVYDFQSSSVDTWLHENQDTISHFAAGNYGENDNLDTTITSPATAKNVVTVGATKSLTQNYISQTIAPVFQINVKVMRNGKTPQYISVRLVKAEFGGDGASLSQQGLRMVRADPPSACGALKGDCKNAIVLARRGQCLFSEKMAAGYAAGAAAVVIVNDRPGGYFKMDAQAQDGQGAQSATIALFALPQRMGEELWALFDNAESITATIERYKETWEAYEDIASFSSFGPATDGRIKPDIVCPGELVSASSANSNPANPTDTCNVGRKSGTSMATPMVAGHASIIRQYFMDGFYPSGAAKATDMYTPSGPAIKAVMMGGACDLKGNTEQYLPLEESPSNRQGFGRLCLCSSLKLVGKCDTSLQVVDRVPITSQDTHKYCLQTAGGDVRIMLTWYDPPAQLSAGITLVNNLDLAVKSAGMGGQVLYGNHGQTADVLNTAERVWLKNAPAGGLEITVTATINTASGTSQNYSLVVQGSFQGVLASPYNPDKSAQGQPMGGCTAAQMLSAQQPTSVTSQPQSVPVMSQPQPVQAPTTLVAPATVRAEVAAEPNVSTQAPGQLPAAAASPTPAEQQDPPSPSPRPLTNDVLIDRLIGALQASPQPSSGQGAAEVAAVSPTSATSSQSQAAPAGGADAPQGRRLSWLPSPPARVTVKVPAFMCQWLTAAGMSCSTLEIYTTAHPQGGHNMHIPLGALIMSGAAAALAMLLYAAIRRHRLARCGSLTSAITANLSDNKRQARQEAAEQLREALLQDPGLAAQLYAAGQQQQQMHSQPAPSLTTSSSSITTNSSLELNATAIPSSGSEPGTPTSVATAGAAASVTAQQDNCHNAQQLLPQRQLTALPAAKSCPIPAAIGTGMHQKQLSEGVDTAAGAPPAASGARSFTFFDRQLIGLPRHSDVITSAATAEADHLDMLRKGTRSFNERSLHFWWQQQKQAAGALSVEASCDSVTVPLPQSRSWDQQQLPPMQRAHSFTPLASSVPFFKGSRRKEYLQAQHTDQGQHCHVVLPDADWLRDQ